MKYAYYYAVVLIGFFYIAGCTPQTSVMPVRPNENVQNADPFDPGRPPSAKTLYIMADILAAQGREQESRLMLERILKEFPDFFPAYSRLAELQMRNRRIPEAIKTLSAGLDINPDDPVLLNNLGMCWLVRKNYEKALEYFTQAAGVLPENTRYRSNMATALLLLNRCDEALALYEQLLPKEEAEENIQLLCGSIKR